MDALTIRTPPPGPTALRASIESAFTAIRIDGGLFPAEFLQAIAAERATGQSAADYGVPPGRTLRDEIGRYWTIAEAMWREYRRDQLRADLAPDRTGVQRWLLRLLRDVLGYVDAARVSGTVYVGERPFPVTHRANGKTVPMLLTIASRDIDRAHVDFGDEGRRRAPHAGMQEYLNADTNALWGLVSDGLRLRLLRDNPSLTRPAYIEADLERIFEEGLYPDFAAFWLIAHASRTTPGPEGMFGCWLEKWRAAGAETGQRALAELRSGVTRALRELGSGFVEHPNSEALRADLRDGKLTADMLHQQLLRLVYRLLFLFTAEGRGLLHSPDATIEARGLYTQGYGLARLRDRARKRRHYDAYSDLWTGLTVTFHALAWGATSLGLPALGGLFEAQQCDRLDTATLSNKRLLTAIHALAFFTDNGALARVNYRDMGTEELGSVYESLLELHPVVQVATRPWSFTFVGDEAGGTLRGSERKRSGSYYTPDSLVQELLRSALDPVIERALRENPVDPRGALLRLRILDPACGSGHFLLGAARRLADAVARLDMEGDLPDEALRRRALREVVRRCIYGVDRNPLSVELCRTALWIEALEPGRPLSFLDAHIKCGDSLIGVTDLSVLKAGIPDEAFKELTGDERGYCRDLKKRNKAERENPNLSLLPEVALPRDLANALSALTEAPEDTLEAVTAKRRALADIESRGAAYSLRMACDLWCTAFFAPRVTRPEMRGRDVVPTTDTIWRYLRASASVYAPLIGVVEASRVRLHFFHWPLEFPEAFTEGGFDCVLGNPPWERIKLQEQEFFGARNEAIAKAPTAAARRAQIASLAHGDLAERAVHRAFEDAKRDAEASSQFVRYCGRFPLTAVGDVNTYALFAEAFLRLPKPQGLAGAIVPTGIVTDYSNKSFFDEVVSRGRLSSLLGFDNQRRIFPSVHPDTPFALITFGNAPAGARYSFYLLSMDHVSDTRRAFNLSATDVRLMNPNTRTSPVFRSSADAELTKRIYARVPVLIDEVKGVAGNPWSITFMRMFDLTNDSRVFRTARQLVDAGAVRAGPDWVLGDGARMVPLYEGKMIHQFDNRWATYESDGETSRDATAAEKSDPTFASTPRYWVPEVEVAGRLGGRGASRKWLMGWRDITNATNERTVIAAAFPRAGIGNSLPLFFPGENIPAQVQACLLGCLCSLTCDYFSRQKVGGTHLNFFLAQQLPVLVPDTYTPRVLSLLAPRIIELTYAAEDMRRWAQDLGYDDPPFHWDEARRANLRAELDASYARLYGLTRDELRYILDPADIYGPDFPSETFRVLKEKEVRQYGEYRTARLVLAAWDRLAADGTFRSWAI
jgi:hypothetical protein